MLDTVYQTDTIQTFAENTCPLVFKGDFRDELHEDNNIGLLKIQYSFLSFLKLVFVCFVILAFQGEQVKLFCQRFLPLLFSFLNICSCLFYLASPTYHVPSPRSFPPMCAPSMFASSSLGLCSLILFLPFSCFTIFHRAPRGVMEHVVGLAWHEG